MDCKFGSLVVLLSDARGYRNFQPDIEDPKKSEYPLQKKKIKKKKT